MYFLHLFRRFFKWKKLRLIWIYYFWRNLLLIRECFRYWFFVLKKLKNFLFKIFFVRNLIVLLLLFKYFLYYYQIFSHLVKQSFTHIYLSFEFRENTLEFLHIFFLLNPRTMIYDIWNKLLDSGKVNKWETKRIIHFINLFIRQQEINLFFQIQAEMIVIFQNFLNYLICFLILIFIISLIFHFLQPFFCSVLISTLQVEFFDSGINIETSWIRFIFF